MYFSLQDRCYDEIINVIGENIKTASMQDFKNLKYVENVINETMRLYTPVPLIARKVEEDVELPSKPMRDLTIIFFYNCSYKQI